MKYSLCEDFLNSKKIIYPMMKYLPDYMAGKRDFAPWAVEVHPTAKCNHRCVHCSYKERNENRNEMPVDMFDRLIESLIKLKVRGVYFSGGGEPCAYRELPKAIKKLNENGIEVALVTNGSLFEESGVMEVADSLNYVAFSVPSVTPEVYENITKRNFAERVLALPEKIKNKYRGGYAPILGARVVVTNLIAEEAPRILEELKKRKFDYALFKIVRDYEDRGLGVSEDMSLKLKEEIETLSKTGKIDHKFTNLDKIFAYQKPYDPAGVCHVNAMGLLAAITPEGDVYPNISEIGREEFKIGNLSEANFEDIWNGKTHESVKAASNKRWQGGKCKNCRAISYNLRINDLLINLPHEEDPFL